MSVIFEAEKKDRVVFHYNKKHNEDQTIPTWVVKHKGETYYVNHFETKVGFTTKETPDNEHTKGSLLVRGILKVEENDGIITATVS